MLWRLSELNEDQKRFLEMLQGIDNNLLQQFGLLVVGIGALFFAYAQTHTHSNLRTVIAMVGLGASIILLMSTYNAFQDSNYIRDRLKGTAFLEAYRDIVSWRSKGRFNRSFYFRPTRLIVYFSVLVSFLWLELVIININHYWPFYMFPIPEWAYIVASGVVIVILVMLALYRRKEDQRN